MNYLRKQQQYNLLPKGLTTCIWYIYDNNIIYCQSVSEHCIGYMYDNNTMYCRTVSELCIGYMYDNNTICYQTASQLCITYMYDNSITDTQWHHNAQNKPLISQREIGHSFVAFSFNKLHFLGTVILNTTISTMTTIQSTVKRMGSEQYNDTAIIIKIV